MAKFKGYEERLINSAYEIFKETYDDVIQMGLDRLPEVPELNGWQRRCTSVMAKACFWRA